MDFNVLNTRYEELPSELDSHERILSLKELYPEYRGLSNAYIVAMLSRVFSHEMMQNSFVLSRKSVNLETSPCAISLLSDLSDSYSTRSSAAGGFFVSQQFFQFENEIEIFVQMNRGKLYCEQFEVRLVGGNDYFNLSSRAVRNGCFITLKALFPTFKRGLIECVSPLQRIRFNVEGFSTTSIREDDKIIKAVTSTDSLAVKKADEIISERKREQIYQREVPPESRFFINQQTINQWFMRARKYNDVYGRFVE